MELAGHVPGRAIKTERLKEIPAKESRDESSAQPPLAEGLQRRVVGSSQLWGWSACREEHPTAAGGGQREPEHGDGLRGFVLAYCSLGSQNVLSISLVHKTQGEVRARTQLSSALHGAHLKFPFALRSTTAGRYHTQ